MVYLPLKMNDPIFTISHARHHVAKFSGKTIPFHPFFTIIRKSLDLASRLNCLHFKYLNMSLKRLFIIISLGPPVVRKILPFVVSEKLPIGPRLDNWHEKLLNDG